MFFDIENYATFNVGGLFGLRTYNFPAPAAFYPVRRRRRAAQHATVVFDCGMQVATPRFHHLNQDLVTEMRVIFLESGEVAADQPHFLPSPSRSA